jgi:hypothetical protein
MSAAVAAAGNANSKKHANPRLSSGIRDRARNGEKTIAGISVFYAMAPPIRSRWPHLGNSRRVRQGHHASRQAQAARFISGKSSIHCGCTPNFAVQIAFTEPPVDLAVSVDDRRSLLGIVL